jgi:hypothetical protein
VTKAADHNDPIGVQATYKAGDSAGGYVVSTNDPAADLADVFVWYTGEQGNPDSVVLAITWRADPVEAREKQFDPTVQYGIHIDTEKEKKLLDVDISASDGLTLGSKLFTKATHDITIWFGEHKTEKGQWGLLVNGLPGVDGEVVGPVGRVIEPADGVKIAAGLFDDAFFADLDGFFNSVSVALGNNPAQNPSLPADRFAKVDPKQQQLSRPFGYPVGVDGFGRQNVHAVVIELPASEFPTRTLHVWATTARKNGLPKTGAEVSCTYDEFGIYRCAEGEVVQ